MRHKSFDIVKYRNKRVKVYVDGDAQSFYFFYKGKEYNCGTFNACYLQEIISVIDADLDKAFYIPNDKVHQPAAKVYQQYGVWYCDYKDFDKLFVNYGDLHKRKQRPSKEILVAKTKELMLFIDAISRDENNETI